MSDKKITQLPASTTPLAGSEVLPIVQSSTTKQVSVANLTAGRDVSARNLYTTENLGVGTTTPATVNGYLYPWRAFQVSASSDVLAVVNGGTGAARLLLTGNGLADQRTWGFQQFGGNLTIAKYADNQASTTSLEFTQNSDVKVNAGNLVVGTAGKGIDFSANAHAAGMTSEVLDWYEEGTWTPAFASTGATITHAQQRGAYTRIGRLVTASVYIQVSSVTGTTTNAVSITGLPFASIAGTEFGFSGAVGVHQFTGYTPSLFITAGTTSITIYNLGTVGGIPASALTPGYYIATISYMTD